jgi:hypothetical protein
VIIKDSNFEDCDAEGGKHGSIEINTLYHKSNSFYL